MRKIDRVKILVGLLIVGAVVLHIFHADDWLPKESEHQGLHQLHRGSSMGTSEAAALELSSTSLPPPPSPTSVAVASATPSDKCFTKPHTEYDGSVVMWGPHTIVDSAAECCAKCRAHRDSEEAKGAPGCKVWVYCPATGGCNGQKHGECWGKTADLKAGRRPTVRAEAMAFLGSLGRPSLMPRRRRWARRRPGGAAIVERRERPGNPRVYFDVRITGSGGGIGGGGRRRAHRVCAVR